MAFTLKLGTLDLSPYPRLAPGDGFDPYDNDWIEPGFTDSPFAEGQPLASVDIKNREMAVPLFLKGASKDALHALTRSVQAEIRKLGTQELLVEWADDGATASTFYTVAFARFEPEYSFRRGQHGWLAGVLRIWVTGYGHTGSYRISATTPVTASAAAVQVPVASIGGDAPALLDVAVRSGSAVSPIYGAQILAAPLSHPSQIAIWAAASMALDAGANATLTGASGAQASQVVAMLSATAAPLMIATQPAIARLTLPIASVYAGQRWRALAVARTHARKGVALNLIGPAGEVGPTAVASLWGGGYTLTDLGVFSVPSIVPTQLPLAVRAGQVNANPYPLNSPQVVVASQPYALSLNRLILLPEQQTHGAIDLALTPLIRWLPTATRVLWATGAFDDLGNQGFSISGAGNAAVYPAVGAVPSSNTNLGNFYIGWQSPQQADSWVMRSVLRFPSGIAGASMVQQQAMFPYGPSGAKMADAYFAMASGAAFVTFRDPPTTNVASTAIPSSAARAFLVEMGMSGPRGWVSARALDGPLPVFASAGASFANTGGPLAAMLLNPQMYAGNALAQQTAASAAALESVEVFAVASQAANPRQQYHLGLRYLADASDNPVRDLSGRVLGAPPVVGPSAPAVAVVSQVPGEAANDLLDVTVRVRERFTIAR